MFASSPFLSERDPVRACAFKNLLHSIHPFRMIRMRFTSRAATTSTQLSGDASDPPLNSPVKRETVTIRRVCVFGGLSVARTQFKGGRKGEAKHRLGGKFNLFVSCERASHESRACSN